MRRGKAFLLRARKIEQKTDAALQKVELYRSMTERITAKLQKDSVSHSRNVTANENAIIRYMEAKEEVRKLSVEYEQVVNDILSVLASMENPSHVKLLTELYLLNQTVKSVAKREHVIRKVHNLLRSAFNQAEKWDLIEKNPARYATIPKQVVKPREIWDAPTLFKAIECCEDQRLKLCLNLAFACSLRIGELLGLTWDCVDISEESILAGNASIFVNKELQRVSKSVMNALDAKDILVTFPEQGSRNKTVLVLKKPKTLSSTRKVFLPKSVAEMLVAWKMEQDSLIDALGSEYMDYQLVIAGSYGFPIEASRIRKLMKDLIKDNDLPPVVFHSLRHSSITYKLKLNGGDIKAVQGDSGHSQAQMVTDQYSHILDENRKQNAELLEKAFYRGKGAGKITAEQQETVQPCQSLPASEADIAQAMRVLSNPEMVKLLKLLSKTIV